MSKLGLSFTPEAYIKEYKEIERNIFDYANIN